jgi:G patch domain/KOW motif-containing protein
MSEEASRKKTISFGISQTPRRPGIKPTTLHAESKQDLKITSKAEPLVIPLRKRRGRPLPEVIEPETVPLKGQDEDAKVSDVNFTTTESEKAEMVKYDSTKYGLQVRCQPKVRPTTKAPLLAHLIGLSRLSESKRLHRDIEPLPDEDSSEYDRVPVEEFGAGLLRGMGWREGQGINGKAPIKPIEPKKRPKGLGLGADPDAAAKWASTEQMDKIVMGGYVEVVKGEYLGMSGIVKEIRYMRIKVQLNVSGEIIFVERNDLIALEKSVQSSKSDTNFDDGEASVRAIEEEEEAVAGWSWLIPHIRVMVTSNTLAAGAYYQQCADVVDVHIDEDGVVRATLNVPDGRTVVIHQGQVEPIRPQLVGQTAVIIAREHRGEVGKVLSIESSEAGRMVHIQIHDSFDVFTIPMEHLALHI